MSYLKSTRNIEDASKEAKSRVSKIFDISAKDIFNRSRAPRSAQARFAVWYILYKEYHISSAAIGRKYGYDHSTILDGIARAIALGIDKELWGQAVDNTQNTGDKIVDIV